MRIEIKTGKSLLYDSQLPGDAPWRVHAAALSERLNKAGSLSLTLPADHPERDKIVPLRSPVTVYRDGKRRWRGRALVPGFDRFGRAALVCEGELNFFQDSAQRPGTLAGTPAEVFTLLIQRHNARVEPWKQFAVGQITVVASTGAISLEIVPGKRTHAYISALLKDYGGYIIFDDADDGTRRINWYAQLPYVCSQPVRAGFNLLDFSSSGNATGFATRIVPYGAELEDGTRLKLDLEGVDYVEDAEAVAQHGIVETSVVYDGVEDPAELERLARADLVRACVIPETFSVNAVDMSPEYPSLGRFSMGHRVPVESASHNAAGLYDLLALEEDLLDPTQGKITLTRDAAYADTRADTITGTITGQQEQIDNPRIRLPGGWMGYVTGSTGQETTTGIGVVHELGRVLGLWTWAGVRLQAGDTMLYLVQANNQIALRGTVDIQGRLLLNGQEITAAATEEGT